MRSRVFPAVCALLMAAALPLGAQVLDNASLSGRYYFVHLQITASNAQGSDGRNLSGTITFNGTGGYTYAGRLGIAAGAPAANSGAGTYTVAANGGVAMASPIRSALTMRAWLSGDRNVLVGASTEAADSTNDMFVAIRAPAANVTNAALNGAYTGAYLSFPNGGSAGVRSAIVTLAAAGNGQFSRVTAQGHAFDQGGRNVTQDAANSTYIVNGDGTGTANFGSAASLFSATRDIFVSQDGNYLIGASNTAGGRDLFVATKNFSASASAAAFDDNPRFLVAEMNVERPSSLSNDLAFSAGSGAVSILTSGRALVAERLRLSNQPYDVSQINLYSVNADSTGFLGPLAVSGLSNMALGASVPVGGTARPSSVVAAQIGTVGAITNVYGIFFAVRGPSFSGTGVFVFPTGVVVNNSAARAPFPNPIAPGSIVELYGAGLAPRVGQAATLPLPLALEGVSVTVGGRTAPLFFVSSSQINIQVPFESSGATATIQVNNGGARSNEVIVPLAATSPSVYSYSDAESPTRAIVTHPDGGLVTPARPTTPGGTVIMYVTGLGALNPPVESGAANGAPPLKLVVDPNVRIYFGGVLATNVGFIGGSPNFAGLNQINVVIPAVVVGNNVPVSIGTSNAFTDVADIPIRSN